MKCLRLGLIGTIFFVLSLHSHTNFNCNSFDYKRDMGSIEKILKKEWHNLFLTPSYDEALIYKMFYRKKPGDMSVPHLEVSIDVIYEGTNLAGFVTYYIKKHHVGHLELLAIDSQFRKKGYGTLLIEHVIQKCKKNGCTVLQLYVYVSNPKAIKFYEHLGFKLKANFGAYILLSKDI